MVSDDNLDEHLALGLTLEDRTDPLEARERVLAVALRDRLLLTRFQCQSL